MPRNYYQVDDEPNPAYYTSEEQEQEDLDDYEQAKEDLAMEEGRIDLN